MKKITIILFLLLACSKMLQAQHIESLTLHQYLEKVGKSNLNYGAEKLNVSAARADAIAAKVFNDPQFSFSYTNNQDHSMQMGQSVEVGLSQTLSLGKRGANIRLTRSQSELTEALLADYFRNLRAEATNAYLDVQKQKQLFAVKQESYSSMTSDFYL